jgi:hypothetical protein
MMLQGNRTNREKTTCGGLCDLRSKEAKMLLLCIKLYILLAVLSLATIFLVQGLIRLFGGSIDSGRGYDVRLLSGMLVSGALSLACSAVLALAFAGSGWAHLGGFFLAYLGFAVISAIYSGSAYRMVSFFATLLGYIVFANWPQAATLLFGWLRALL